jgi:exosortase O
MHTSQQIEPAVLRSALRQSLPAGLVTLALLGLWLWLYRPVFAYLAVIFSREDFRTNQVLLLGALLLIGLQMRGGDLKPAGGAAPQLSGPALSLALGSSALYLLVERFLDVNTLSASLFGLASYGLLGLWLRPARWRQGLPAALLLIGALPFGDHLQTFVGYPMRILTATVVRDGLAAAGVGAVGVDTILVFENGVSQVDLPCSGVKSLWTGGLFLIAATWIERRPLNARWLLTALVFAGLLFIANLARVAVLITVGEVWGWRLAAQLLHVPLGVLAFAGACGLALGLLRLIPPLPPAPAAPKTDRLPRPQWLAPALALAIAGMALLYTPRPQTGLAGPPPEWSFPAELGLQPLPLKPDEVEWLTRDGADSASRFRFEWQGRRGSAILITSQTWRAHHRPERCFEVYGLRLEDSRTVLMDPGFPVRAVSLGDGAGHSVFSALYWFQSAASLTDDYGARLWADVRPQRQTWVLVSILFDDAPAAEDPAVRGLALALRAAVAGRLEGAIP